MSQRVKQVVANWKMNGNAVANGALLSALREGSQTQGKAQVTVCVPFVYLSQVRCALSGSALRWGAQDVSEFPPGAYTGDVSLEMLQDFGCSVTLVGHSERRRFYAESDQRCAAKALRALRGKMSVCLCVGEREQEHRSGQTANVVRSQLNVLLEQLDADDCSRLMVAYEPVWAIGTGQAATPEQAQEVHAMLRDALRQVAGTQAERIPILYGGSVKPDNARALFAMPDIDGGLIGGASLVAKDFLDIVTAAGATAT
jgi:triosephosphate isomerase